MHNVVEKNGQKICDTRDLETAPVDRPPKEDAIDMIRSALIMKEWIKPETAENSSLINTLIDPDSIFHEISEDELPCDHLSSDSSPLKQDEEKGIEVKEIQELTTFLNDSENQSDKSDPAKKLLNMDVPEEEISDFRDSLNPSCNAEDQNSVLPIKSLILTPQQLPDTKMLTSMASQEPESIVFKKQFLPTKTDSLYFDNELREDESSINEIFEECETIFPGNIPIPEGEPLFVELPLPEEDFFEEEIISEIDTIVHDMAATENVRHEEKDFSQEDEDFLNELNPKEQKFLMDFKLPEIDLN